MSHLVAAIGNLTNTKNQFVGSFSQKHDGQTVSTWRKVVADRLIWTQTHLCREMSVGVKMDVAVTETSKKSIPPQEPHLQDDSQRLPETFG